MSFFHHAATGALVPTLVKKLLPYTGKIFGVTEIDEETKKKVANLEYPWYYGILYAFWMTVLMGVGLSPIVLVTFLGFINFPDKGFAVFALLGILNMIGAFALLNGLVNALFWHASRPHFRDYVRLRLIRSGSGYVIEQQIKVMIKVGTVYYIVLLPIMVVLLFLL